MVTKLEEYDQEESAFLSYRVLVRTAEAEYKV